MEWVCYRDFRHESMLRDAGFGLRRKIFLMGTTFSGFGCSAFSGGREALEVNDNAEVYLLKLLGTFICITRATPPESWGLQGGACSINV